jgi:hypothetical protein
MKNNWYVYEETCLIGGTVNNLIGENLTDEEATDLLNDYRQMLPELTFMISNTDDNPHEYKRLKNIK